MNATLIQTNLHLVALYYETSDWSIAKIKSLTDVGRLKLGQRRQVGFSGGAWNAIWQRPLHPDRRCGNGVELAGTTQLQEVKGGAATGGRGGTAWRPVATVSSSTWRTSSSRRRRVRRGGRIWAEEQDEGGGSWRREVGEAHTAAQFSAGGCPDVRTWTASFARGTSRRHPQRNLLRPPRRCCGGGSWLRLGGGTGGRRGVREKTNERTHTRPFFFEGKKHTRPGASITLLEAQLTVRIIEKY